jgi:hypothetical protein
MICNSVAYKNRRIEGLFSEQIFHVTGMEMVIIVEFSVREDPANSYNMFKVILLGFVL